MNSRAWVARLLLAVGLAIALSYTTSHVDLTAPNERSRLYLTVALFEQRSFVIDTARNQFGAVFDEATFGGHYFTDKAPGASLLALLPYAVVRLFVDGQHVTLPLLLGIGRYAVMVPLGIVAFFAFESLCTGLGLGRPATRFAALSYLLATPAFHYSAAFFGHQIVGTTLLLALLLIVKQRSLSTKAAGMALVSAGVLAGVAGLTEYQALLGVLGLCATVVTLSEGRRIRAFSYFALGGLPCALFLAYYHRACFGGPFELSYHHLSHLDLAEVHRQGLGGVSVPSLAGLTGSLFSLHRGLFATSPHLLLSFYGVWCWSRRGHAALAHCIAATALGYCVFVAASATWEAGWGYGPRLLVPVLPMLSLFVAAALDDALRSSNRRQAILLSGLVWSALLVSVMSFQVITALFPEPPVELQNPWLDVVLPLASSGVVAPNLGARVFGLMVLFAMFGSTLVETWRSWRSSAWGLLLPIIPALVCVLVEVQGPSGTPKERADFVGFARLLYSSQFSSVAR